MCSVFSLSYEEWLKTIDLLVKVLASVAAVIGFVVAYSRYRKDQTWKRNELVATEIKEFNSNPMVRNARYMLDWRARKIELFPCKENYDDRFVLVTRDMVTKALDIHDDRPEPLPGMLRYSEIEIAIRDNFDTMLSFLGRFNRHVKAGLMTIQEIKPYLEYWLTSIAMAKERPEQKALHDYIVRYDFDQLLELAKDFNHDFEATAKQRTSHYPKPFGCDYSWEDQKTQVSSIVPIK